MRVPQSAPAFLQSLSTDEYPPQPLPNKSQQAVFRAQALAERALEHGDHKFWAGRQGTAAGLISLNLEWGEEYFRVPRAAVEDLQAANEALGGDQVVIDVQTHYLADRSEANLTTEAMLKVYRQAMPSWWTGLDGMVAYDFAEYLRCVFLETETAVAILTSGPGRGPERMLHNNELAGTRRLLDELGPRKRLLNHAVVHPTAHDELEAMETWRDEYRPAGWKVYTLGEMTGIGMWQEGSRWMLDDERTGVVFLDRVRELGTDLVCAHKGLSRLVEAGSPRDVGPAAAGFPDIRFVIYHSGYEWPESEDSEEGAYSDEVAHLGTNRLIKSLKDNGIGPGGNVYAELGTTWFAMLRRPREAAHVLGKLLVALGEDNIIWGTDSIWYGPTQPLIDAFRVFQIPAWMRERYGYPELTPAIRDKILCRNAARVYGFDIAALADAARTDPISWTRAAELEARRDGLSVRR